MWILILFGVYDHILAKLAWLTVLSDTRSYYVTLDHPTYDSNMQPIKSGVNVDEKVVIDLILFFGHSNDFYLLAKRTSALRSESYPKTCAVNRAKSPLV